MKVIKAEPEHIVELALMLQEMYKEVFTATAVKDINLYINEIVRCFNDPAQVVYTTDTLQGILIVVDATDSLTPLLKRYEATRVYVKPEYRHSRVLKEFYNRIFLDYTDGDILGFTEINSTHIAVLDKRHTLIAKVYKLNRS